MKLFLIAAATALALLVTADSAAAQTAPALSVSHAACYQSVIDADDLFCLGRYELPQSIADGVSDAWCAELVDGDGCDGTPADPTAGYSLPPNTVFTTLYDGCTAGDCSAGTLLNVSRVPRIGHALSGSYLTAGHALTFGDADIHLCMESSTDPAVYATGSIDCTAVTWASGANTTTVQRELLGQDMVEQVRAIGILESEPTAFYVENNRINSRGKIFALEALGNADRILDIFTEGSTAIVVPGSTPAAGSTVQANINSGSASVQAAKTDFGTTLGVTADAVGLLISVIIVIGLFVLLRVIGVDLMFALIIAAGGATSLTLLGLLPFQALAVFIAVLALPAAVRVVRTVTTS